MPPLRPTRVPKYKNKGMLSLPPTQLSAFYFSVCQVVHLCSDSYHRKRCPLAAEALAPRWEAD